MKFHMEHTPDGVQLALDGRVLAVVPLWQLQAVVMRIKKAHDNSLQLSCGQRAELYSCDHTYSGKTLCLQIAPDSVLQEAGEIAGLARLMLRAACFGSGDYILRVARHHQAASR